MSCRHAPAPLSTGPRRRRARGTRGWVTVDAGTLATAFRGVYAIGDSTAIPLASGLPLPKAGLFAETEGYVVADQIAAMLDGTPASTRFWGEGTCYAEVAGDEAIKIAGRFLADPPVIEISPPSRSHVAHKRVFESERLEAWFGHKRSPR